jgi:hypothetical protein
VRSPGVFVEIRNAASVRKPGMKFTLSNVGPCVLAVLAMTTIAGPVHAQTGTYSVEARAITGTMPGAGATYVGPILEHTTAHALHDPAALQWVYNVNQLVFSDAVAESWTDIGSLSSHAFALAQRVKATNFPPGVTASTMGRWTDRVKVVSATLPVGAPVILTFANTMTIDREYAGLFDGKASCLFQAGGASTTASWSAAHNKAETSTSAPLLVIKTTVGATLSLNARLDTFARGWFFVPGPRYDGQLELDATCDQSLVSATGDVSLLADSGVDFAAP